MPIGVYQRPPPTDRFWSKVEKTDSCWSWRGWIAQNGYGYFRLYRNTKPTCAHILAYEFIKGEVPNGKELHHICNNKSCVNPNHLKPTQHKEHMVDLSPKSISYINKRKTHCPQGHEYNEENTYFYPNGDRDCRSCGYIQQKKYREKFQK